MCIIGPIHRLAKYSGVCCFHMSCNHSKNLDIRKVEYSQISIVISLTLLFVTLTGLVVTTREFSSTNSKPIMYTIHYLFLLVSVVTVVSMNLCYLVQTRSAVEVTRSFVQFLRCASLYNMSEFYLSHDVVALRRASQRSCVLLGAFMVLSIYNCTIYVNDFNEKFFVWCISLSIHYYYISYVTFSYVLLNTIIVLQNSYKQHLLAIFSNKPMDLKFRRIQDAKTNLNIKYVTQVHNTMFKYLRLYTDYNNPNIVIFTLAIMLLLLLNLFTFIVFFKMGSIDWFSAFLLFIMSLAVYAMFSLPEAVLRNVSIPRKVWTEVFQVWRFCLRCSAFHFFWISTTFLSIPFPPLVHISLTLLVLQSTFPSITTTPYFLFAPLSLSLHFLDFSSSLYLF